MKNRNFYYRYLILIISIIMSIGFFNFAWAIAPEIYSITPNTGYDEISTFVTIKGVNFQPTPTIALYGVGPYITGACDTPGYPHGIHVAGSYAYVADENAQRSLSLIQHTALILPV